MLAAILVLSSCEPLEIPAITDPHVTESSPAVISATAIMKSKQIDECGVIFSSKTSSPTLSKNDGIVYGTLDGNGSFSATVPVEANVTYYFVFFATNEIGTTTSESLKLTTNPLSPKQEDNPLPKP